MNHGNSESSYTEHILHIMFATQSALPLTPGDAMHADGCFLATAAVTAAPTSSLPPHNSCSHPNEG